MRLKIGLTLVVLVSVVIMIAGCAWPGKAGTQVGVKMLGRRLGFHGAQMYPQRFETLGRVAESACEVLADRAKALQGAFGIIAKVIADELKDPILHEELMELVELVGIELDPEYGVSRVTVETQAGIEAFVCSFAVGVDRALIKEE
ncbi:hypothetical protein ES703_59314 [subsurface metagenome]